MVRIMSTVTGRLLTGLLLVVLAAGCRTTTTTVAGVEVPVAGKSEADPRKRAEIRTELASTYYREGRLAVALEETKRALQIDSSYASAHGLLGLIYMDIGERGEAEASFRRALRLEPDNSDILNNYGWFLCQTDRERESVEYFERALRDPLYTTPSRAAQNAGSCLLKLKDYPAAERYLRRAFELDASNAGTKYLLSRTYLATGQVDRATFYYNLLAKSVESTPETLWLGVRVARANGDLRTESQLARELRERFPRSPEVAALAKGEFNE